MYIPLKNKKRILVPLMVLKDPKYSVWVLHFRKIYGEYVDAKEEISILIDIFNRKPILQKCYNKNCDKPAVRFSIDEHTNKVYCWCKDCDYYQLYKHIKWSVDIYTYLEAYVRVRGYDNYKPTYKKIIQQMARAKGLAKRVGEKQAIDFFYK